ncbi:MAG: sigma-70 family RNA polymerase sigma factor [Acidimicrobiales bacterium]|nr:sigma-70 family RNA polymerase sigma factor [Acidimicrobiales bacterium]
MTEVASGDAELLARVRAGDHAAFGLLYERHRAAARSVARGLTRGAGDAEDLVSESFTRVLCVIERGKGPAVAFRPYLLTAMRRIHWERTRVAERERPTDLTADVHLGDLFIDPALDGLEGTLAVEAFKRLPERWRMVLWHTQVEQLEPAEVAPLLGISPNAVAALAYRAREALRRAYLEAHVGRGTHDEVCHHVCQLLPAKVRGGLSATGIATVDRHLSICDDCRAFHAELSAVNAGMRSFVGPAVLGLAAADYLRAPALEATSPATTPSARKVRRRPPRRLALAAGTTVAVLVVAALARAQVVDRGEEPRAATTGATATPVVPVDPRASGSDHGAAGDSSSTTSGPAAVVSAHTVTRLPPGAPGSTSPAEPALVPVPVTPGDPGVPTTSTLPTTTTVPFVARADLAVEAEPVGVLVAGRDGMIAVTVANRGPDAAASLHLAVELPAQLTFVSASGASWRCGPDAEGATCERDRLVAGADQVLYLRLHAASPATDEIVAAVTLSSAGPHRAQGSTRATLPVPIAEHGMSAVYADERVGDIAVIGNNLSSCPDAAGAACLGARDRVGADLDNNDWAVAPVDADADTTTSSSSAATLARPAGAEVAWARLYWGGDTAAGVGGAAADVPSSRARSASRRRPVATTTS